MIPQFVDTSSNEREYCLVLTNTRVDLALLNRLTSSLVPPTYSGRVYGVIIRFKSLYSVFKLQIIVHKNKPFSSMLETYTERLDKTI